MSHATNLPEGSNDNGQWEQHWQLELQQAQQRPAMYIGNPQTAHLNAISQALNLVFRARVFREPLSASVHLSPTQYVIKCVSGPLLRSIESVSNWDEDQILTRDWNITLGRLREQYSSNILDGKRQLRGWKKYFGSPYGPTLASPISLLSLTHYFAFAYKISTGYWSQTFSDGLPLIKPSLLKRTTPTGFIIIAALEPEWFTGLPFTLDTINGLNKKPHINAWWHPVDNLVHFSTQPLTEIEEWL